MNDRRTSGGGLAARADDLDPPLEEALEQAVRDAARRYGATIDMQLARGIELKPRDQRPAVEHVIQDLRRTANAFPGLRVFMQPIQNINFGARQTRTQYLYTLQGLKLDELYDWAPRACESFAASCYGRGLPAGRVRLIQTWANQLKISITRSMVRASTSISSFVL